MSAHDGNHRTRESLRNPHDPDDYTMRILEYSTRNHRMERDRGGEFLSDYDHTVGTPSEADF